MNDNSSTSSLECQYEKETKVKEERSVFIGLIFAFIFAIIGTIPWVVVGVLGYVASYCGLIICFCAVEGYSMYTHKKTVLAGVSIIVICFVAFLFALYMTDVIVIYNDFKSEGADVMFLFQNLYKSILYQSEYQQHFLGNGIMGVIFLAIGMRIPLFIFFSEGQK